MGAHRIDPLGELLLVIPQIHPVFYGHMFLFHHGISAKHLAADMDCHPAATEKHFYRIGCQPQIDLFAKFNRKGEFISYSEKTDVITKRLELCGYFCLITSEKMTASDALIHYKGRDISEKLFSSDKSFIGSKSMRVQSDEALSAKIFIEFIALIVRNRMYNLLKDRLLKMETRQNYLTVPASIRELEKIEMVRRNNGQYRLDHAVSKRQRTILSAFGMDDDDIRSLANDISNMLANNQSLLSETKEEDTYEQDTFDIFD